MKYLFILLLVTGCDCNKDSSSGRKLPTCQMKRVTEIGVCDDDGWCAVKFSDNTFDDVSRPMVGREYLHRTYDKNNDRTCEPR